MISGGGGEGGEGAVIAAAAVAAAVAAAAAAAVARVPASIDAVLTACWHHGGRAPSARWSGVGRCASSPLPVLDLGGSAQQPIDWDGGPEHGEEDAAAGGATERVA